MGRSGVKTGLDKNDKYLVHVKTGQVGSADLKLLFVKNFNFINR